MPSLFLGESGISPGWMIALLASLVLLLQYSSMLSLPGLTQIQQVKSGDYQA